MRRALKWLVTVGAGTAVFASSWWVCEGWLGIDRGTAQQVASVLFGLVTLPLAWWAAIDAGKLASMGSIGVNRAHELFPAQSAGPLPDSWADVGRDGRVVRHVHVYRRWEPVRWPHRVGVVPAAADAFQHRVIADGVCAVLTVDETEVATQVLSGLGGTGKTQVAAFLARRMWDQQAVDLLVWVTADSVEPVVAGYAQAGADVLGASSDDPVQAAQRFLVWLAQTSRPWLVVLDDLADPAVLGGWWPPSTPNGRVVVTTRRRDAAMLGAGRRLVPVGLYTPEEAAAYLGDKLSGRSGLLVGAAELAADVGLLPLALSQAAAYLLDRDISCADYRIRWARRRLAELLPEPGALPDEHRATVAATWSLSVQAANELTPVGLAHPMLRVLSVLDPNGVPEAVLTSPPVLEYLTSSRTEPGGSMPVGADDARDGLHCLYRFNLASPSTGALPVVRIHALVQRATREQGTIEQIGAAATAAADALLHVWPDIERDPTFGQLLRTNTTSLRRSAADALWSRSRGRRAVLFRAGESLGMAGLSVAAITYFDDLAAEAAVRLGPDHVDTMGARRELASWRGEIGDAVGAAAVYALLLTDQERVLGPDHRDTLSTRRDLVVQRGEAGDVAGAAVALEQLITECGRVLGPDHPDTLWARVYLARYQGWAGDPAGAPAVFEQLLADYLRVYGADHVEILYRRYDVAYWRGDAGDPAVAAAAFGRLLSDCLRRLGPDNPFTLHTRHNLARWQGEAGDPAGAAAGFEQLLPDCLRVLGPDHQRTLATRAYLGRWRGEAGDPAGAAETLDQVLTDCLRNLGPNHRHTLTTRHDLARWRGEAGDLAGAITELEQLLADCLQVRGLDHPYTLHVRRDLARWRQRAETS